VIPITSSCDQNKTIPLKKLSIEIPLYQNNVASSVN